MGTRLYEVKTNYCKAGSLLLCFNPIIGWVKVTGNLPVSLFPCQITCCFACRINELHAETDNLLVLDPDLENIAILRYTDCISELVVCVD